MKGVDMTAQSNVSWLDEAKILETLARYETEDPGRIRAILDKSLALQGLSPDDVAALATVRRKDLLEELFATARKVKEEIYGRRLVLFAPLYISNLCRNECLYCAFRSSNTKVRRRALSQAEIADETRVIVDQGHKRILLVAGESGNGDGFEYILDAIATVYAVKEDKGEIRRLNVNIAPLPLENFKQLKQAGIGTYQLFQETYHRKTYGAVHARGPKSDYNWRISAMDRAMAAGIDDVGVGVLFGLHDWRFEILALMQHIAHLEDAFGVGCHTISVPRLEPAVGSEIASNPPHPVSDEDFRKIIAILRLAVPYTGMIMSTRETAAMRAETFALGVSQISAGSRTNPGGYGGKQDDQAGQFQLGDHRPLAEVIQDVCDLGYIPSFCTACYRLGRTGQDFMDLAKPGLIKEKCAPNALSTFKEYLIDYGLPQTRIAGDKAIERELTPMAPKTQRLAKRLLKAVSEGRRDVYC
jgi:2-iminoacetate synthase